MFLWRWSQSVLGMCRAPLAEELWLPLLSQRCCCPGRAVTSQGLFAGTAEHPGTQALTPDSDHAPPLAPCSLASGS